MCFSYTSWCLDLILLQVCASSYGVHVCICVLETDVCNLNEQQGSIRNGMSTGLNGFLTSCGGEVCVHACRYHLAHTHLDKSYSQRVCVGSCSSGVSF